MKKRKYLVFMLFLSVFLIPIVNASTSKNGIVLNDNKSQNDNTFTLYCSYNNDFYILIDRASTNDNGNIETNIGLIKEASDATLKQYNFLDSDGNLDCPKYIETEADRTTVINLVNNFSVSDKTKFHYSLKPNESSCTGKCSNNQSSIEKPIFNCFYLSQNSDKKITISREQEGGDIYITYPDNTKAITSYPITETCQDFYFNTDTKKIKLASYEYLGNITQFQTYDPIMYEFICGSSSENNGKVEYFCSESCKFSNNANIKCEEISNTIHKGNINLDEVCQLNGMKNTLRFIGYLLFIVKIIIPILLIILGIIDFSKSIISFDTDSLQKSIKNLIKRIILSIVIFLIPTLVNYCFKVIIKGNVNQYEKCRICIFEPNKCN